MAPLAETRRELMLGAVLELRHVAFVLVLVTSSCAATPGPAREVEAGDLGAEARRQRADAERRLGSDEGMHGEPRSSRFREGR